MDANVCYSIERLILNSPLAIDYIQNSFESSVLCHIVTGKCILRSQLLHVYSTQIAFDYPPIVTSLCTHTYTNPYIDREMDKQTGREN